MKINIIKVVLVGMFLAMTATVVRSAPVTYYFSGALQDAFGTLPVGTAFCGSFTYDDAQPLNTPSTAYRGDYTYTNFTVTFGTTTITDNGTGVINLYNNPYPTDMFHLYPFSLSGSLGGQTLAAGAGLEFILQDLTRTVWSTPAVLPSGLTLSNFTVNPGSHASFLQLRATSSTMLTARGELTQLSNTPMLSCVPCVKAPPNMVAWYPFDEPPFTLSAAEFANWNNGASINAPTTIAGVVGNGLNFDGINDYVQSADQAWLNPGTGDFSIDAWIRPNAAAITIVDKRLGTVPTLRGYSFFVSGGRIGLQLADGLTTPGFANYTSPILAPAVTNGSWHHVAVTVRRTVTTGITWYYDGVAVGNSNPTARTGSLNNTSPLRIGTRTAVTPLTGWFRGGVDELEIFNRALSSAEVAGIFNAGANGKCKCK